MLYVIARPSISSIKLIVGRAAAASQPPDQPLSVAAAVALSPRSSLAATRFPPAAPCSTSTSLPSSPFPRCRHERPPHRSGPRRRWPRVCSGQRRRLLAVAAAALLLVRQPCAAVDPRHSAADCGCDARRHVRVRGPRARVHGRGGDGQGAAGQSASQLASHMRSVILCSTVGWWSVALDEPLTDSLSACRTAHCPCSRSRKTP